MKRPAVFIDRDGTINEQMGYINHIKRFVILDGTAEAIRILNRNKFLAIIVSNQSGVARGYFPIELVNEVHEHMIDLLKKKNAFIDGIYFCPHYAGGSVKEYSIPCNCRKPDTGLISKASEHLSIDMSRSYVIGDRLSDIELSYRANLKGILVKTGYGLGDLKYLAPYSPFQPLHVAENLLHAVRWIIENEKPDTKLEECKG